MHLSVKVIRVFLTVAAILPMCRTIDLLLPDGLPVNLNHDEICFNFPMPQNEVHYIRNVRDFVDHFPNIIIALMGCREATVPGKMGMPWRCKALSLHRHNTCGAGIQTLSHQLFTTQNIGSDMAFRVGGNSSIQHLVVSVHYHRHGDQILPPDQQFGVTKSAGVLLDMIPESENRGRITKLAGLWELAAVGGSVPAHTTHSALSYSCRVQTAVPMHLVSALGHYHTNGIAISSSLVSQSLGNVTLMESPKYSPIDKHQLVRVKDGVIGKGDTVTVTCVYRNPKDTDILIGDGLDEEMCGMSYLYYAYKDFVPLQCDRNATLVL